MRLVVQRVDKASVRVEGKVIGSIEKGLFVLVGVKEGDSEENAVALAEKIAKLRVMADDDGKMNLSVNDAKSSMLVVSQFTLYADTSGGNRPSFIKAAVPELADKLYNLFVQNLIDAEISVETGEFGAYMEIDLVLDGPVTIILEND